MKHVINSFQPEFGYELLSVIPYTYHLHKQGELEATLSGKHTKDWYYFSPNHTELDIPRHGINNQRIQVPNKNIHTSFDLSQWEFPDYKNHFKSEGDVLFKDLKNLVIISNKYNIEWGQSPTNYIHTNTLDKIFNYLTNQGYTVVYNRLTSDLGYDDGVDCMPLGDFELIEDKYPNVLTIQQLINTHKLNLNELQLRLYPLCDKFVSVQGGTSIVSSMFGGRNIALVNRGYETMSGIYNTVFPLLSDVKLNIVGAFKTPDNSIGNLDQYQSDLFQSIKTHY